MTDFPFSLPTNLWMKDIFLEVLPTRKHICVASHVDASNSLRLSSAVTHVIPISVQNLSNGDFIGTHLICCCRFLSLLGKLTPNSEISSMQVQNKLKLQVALMGLSPLAAAACPHQHLPTPAGPLPLRAPAFIFIQ